MKISLKLANGATLEFEGDEKEFERVSAFLAEPPDSLTATASRVRDVPPKDAPERDVVGGGLSPAAVDARLLQVGAANDQERMTVMAQMAMDAGREGIDFDTLTRLYTELALKKPAQFPTKTLSNAKYAGLVQPVKPGVWRTTYKGENFAKGHGRGDRRTQRSKDRAAEPPESA